MKETLILTGGGTAGHVMPNLALVPYLRDKFELHYVGSPMGIERKLAENAGLYYHPISVVKLDRSRKLQNVAMPVKLLQARAQAKALLKEIRPAAVFSKGGYVALPVALAAKCPLFIHESDYTMGLANKLVAKKAEAVFTSFENTASGRKNGVFTGSPIRRQLYQGSAERARKELRFTAPLPTLLIIGGSTGAKAINDCVYKCADTLANKFNIIHITGAGNEQSGIRHPNYRAIRFTEHIEDYFALSDLAVTRGGSGVLFELAALKIPALVIPLPAGGASRGDQVLNAKYFSERGYVTMLEQSALTPATLAAELENLYRMRAKFAAALAGAKQVDGTRAIVEHMLGWLEK